MAAYCTTTTLETFLQRELTTVESDGAAVACAAATDYIDRYLSRSWQGGTISSEVHEVYGPKVYLDRKPVATVTTVTARSPIVGEAARTLTSGTGYDVLDAANGVLLVGEPHGTLLTVTYTISSTPPDLIVLAANIIAAWYLVSGPSQSGSARGIQKLKAGSAEITYDPIDASAPVPKAATDLLEAYGPAVVFA